MTQPPPLRRSRLWAFAVTAYLVAGCGSAGGTGDGPGGSDPGDAGPDVSDAADGGPCVGIGTWSQITTVGAPSERSAFVLAWTGAEMLVWGGEHFFWEQEPPIVTTFDDGGRYDPTADAWTPMTLANAPARRAFPLGVWTGSEMIVWGGRYVSILRDGGRYDPAADSWTAMSTAGAPTAHAEHSAVWTGSEMIVWGESGSSPHLPEGGRYDPAADSWTTMSVAGAPEARFFHKAVWTGSEMIVWGGLSALTPLGTGGRYDPVLDAWSTMSTIGAPSPRLGHSAVWTGSRFVVWGGRTDPGFGGLGLNDGGAYDPITDTWSALATEGAPNARSGHTAVWTGSHMIVWGASVYDPAESPGTGGLYDPATDSWQPTSLCNAPRNWWSAGAVWTGAQMIISVGHGGWLYAPP